MANPASALNWPELPAEAYIVLAVVIAALVAILGFAGWKRDRVEDPARISAFLGKVKDLDWASGQASGSLRTLFDSVTELVRAEIFYYYRSRTARRGVAVATRFGAF